MKKRLGPLFVILFVMGTSPVLSQATRTWVSGVGDDVNPCSRTAPCKTLAGAISKTATGGEINILDPGGFGAVTITKSITIDGGGVMGSILSSAVNGIVINAPNAMVTLRNFSINGAGTILGTNGIRLLAAGKLHVENCILSNFSGYGLEINSTNPVTVSMNGVTIVNSKDGIGMNCSTGKLTIDNSHFQNLGNSGLTLQNGQATVSNSIISGSETGISLATGATVYLTGNTITNNTTGLKGPGKFNSAGNNLISGNNAQGVNTSPVKLQ
jgi:hypothetical protein